MADVAVVAGMSHQAVSRVVSENPLVRDEMRPRERRAMDLLGYPCTTMTVEP